MQISGILSLYSSVSSRKSVLRIQLPCTPWTLSSILSIQGDCQDPPELLFSVLRPQNCLYTLKWKNHEAHCAHSLSHSVTVSHSLKLNISKTIISYILMIFKNYFSWEGKFNYCCEYTFKIILIYNHVTVLHIQKLK